MHPKLFLNMSVSSSVKDPFQTRLGTRALSSRLHPYVDILGCIRPHASGNIWKDADLKPNKRFERETKLYFLNYSVSGHIL